MGCFKLTFTVQRQLTCYVEAESEDEVERFLASNDEWVPGDTPGFIDKVGDENEVGLDIEPESTVVPNFRITPQLTLDER